MKNKPRKFRCSLQNLDKVTMLTLAPVGGAHAWPLAWCWMAAWLPEFPDWRCTATNRLSRPWWRHTARESCHTAPDTTLSPSTELWWRARMSVVIKKWLKTFLLGSENLFKYNFYWNAWNVRTFNCNVNVKCKEVNVDDRCDSEVFGDTVNETVSRWTKGCRRWVGGRDWAVLNLPQDRDCVNDQRSSWRKVN